MPVRKHPSRPNVRQHRKRPNFPPPFSSVGGGAKPENEMINEPGYKKDHKNITPIKSGGAQIVMVAKIAPHRLDESICSSIKSTHNKKSVRDMSPDSKLQFKMPFVENFLMKASQQDPDEMQPRDSI